MTGPEDTEAERAAALRHTDIDPKGRTPEPSFGADEEGEAPLPRPDVDDDPAAWVHVDDA